MIKFWEMHWGSFDATSEGQQKNRTKFEMEAIASEYTTVIPAIPVIGRQRQSSSCLAVCMSVSDSV